MSLQMHPGYERIIKKARESHREGRSPAGITTEDIDLARLYSYAYRLHSIGVFHATRLAIESRPVAGALAMAHRTYAIELLQDLANQGMDPVGDDFHALISTLHRYDSHVQRVINALEGDLQASRDEGLAPIADRFREVIEEITTGNGIHLTRDTRVPHQASFIVPNLGITIVPLVYGDHHSWNLAYLEGENRDVPTHLHHQGVEIHLGFGPLKGITILGNDGMEVTEGYAMAIPPETAHGFVNTSDDIPHHVPFIFGSLIYAGWGVFLDVEPQSRPVDQLNRVRVDDPRMLQTIYLEREIAAIEAMGTSQRKTIIPASLTDRNGTGGLELSVSRVTERGLSLPVDRFRTVSIVRGEGVVRISEVQREVRTHDHFGIPEGMSASLRQTGSTPLVILDALLKPSWRTRNLS